MAGEKLFIDFGFMACGGLALMEASASDYVSDRRISLFARTHREKNDEKLAKQDYLTKRPRVAKNKRPSTTSTNFCLMSFGWLEATAEGEEEALVKNYYFSSSSSSSREAIFVNDKLEIKRSIAAYLEDPDERRTCV